MAEGDKIYGPGKMTVEDDTCGRKCVTKTTLFQMDTIIARKLVESAGLHYCVCLGHSPSVESGKNKEKKNWKKEIRREKERERESDTHNTKKRCTMLHTGPPSTSSL